MANEERIVSMLDVIAAQVTTLTETSVTKDEFKGFKEQTYDRFSKIEKKMNSIEENVITKDEFMGFKEQVNERFSKLDSDNSAAHETVLTKMDKQSEFLDGKFDVLNKRIFSQALS